MKPFTGKFDIRDHYGGNTPNCSVYSLKLTDKAFNELQAAIKNKRAGLQIKFASENEGKIRFDPSKSWGETPDSFSETTESKSGKLSQKETFLIAHDPGADFVLNYGELTKAFKINPNIKDSFAKTANKHKEIGDNRKVTEVLKPKMSRNQPKYARNRDILSRKPQEPDSTTARTPTPPPNLAVKEQYGSVETRVLHIVAANSNKLTTEKLKEILHQRKLCVVGVDIAKVPQILDKIAVQRNNKKWSLKKEIWPQVQINWSGYNARDKTNVVESMAAEKESSKLALKRKSNEDSDSRSTTPSAEDDNRTKRKKMDISVPRSSKPPSDLDNSSRDSFQSRTHFEVIKPVESPMSSNGSVQPSPNLSEPSQASPLSPVKISKSPPLQSPVQPKSSLAERYKNLKKDLERKEKNKRKDNKTRSRKMSSEEVSENAKRYQLRPQDEQKLKEELDSKYPLPVTNEEALRYRKQCEKDYKRYDELRPTIEQVASRFDKLQHEMARLKNGSSEYQTHYRKVIEEYRKLVNIGYFEKRREYNECSQRCAHIKRRLKEYYETNIKSENS